MVGNQAESGDVDRIPAAAQLPLDPKTRDGEAVQAVGRADGGPADGAFRETDALRGNPVCPGPSPTSQASGPVGSSCDSSPASLLSVVVSRRAAMRSTGHSG